MIADRRRLAFVTFNTRPLHSFDRIVGDRIRVTEMLEEGRERGELPANRRSGELAILEVFAPGNDVRTFYDPKFFRPRDPGEAHEFADVVLVDALGK